MQRDLLLLGEIVEAAERLQALTDGLTVEDIAEDELRRDAVLRNFTVLGEATAQLSEELRAETRHRRVAPASAAAKPDRPRLLVDRPRDPRQDGH